MANPTADRFEHDTIAILKRLSRRPIEPSSDSELMTDLGFYWLGWNCYPWS